MPAPHLMYLEVIESHDVFMFQFLGQKRTVWVREHQQEWTKAQQSRAESQARAEAPTTSAHLKDLDFLAQQRLGLGEVLLVNALDGDLQVVLLESKCGQAQRLKGN